MSKRKCLFLTEADIDHDGRTLELIDVMKETCETTVVCFRANSTDDNKYEIEVKKAVGPFRRIRSTFRLSRKAKNNLQDILFIDNSKACVDAALILLSRKASTIILDTRELYLKGEKRSVLMNIICWFERRMIQKADYIIAANESRAHYMKEYYHLDITPAVFENIRKIVDRPQTISELDKFVQTNDKLISYTGGLMKDREIPLLYAIKKLDRCFKLAIAGRCTDEEKTRFTQVIIELDIEDRVLYLGEINRGQLRYLIQDSYIGSVYYEGKSVNEKYCASGKIFEYMFEGIPFISPLLNSHMDLEKKWGVCACDSDLAVAIDRIHRNYDHYRSNVSTYIVNVSEGKNRENLIEKLNIFLYEQ